MPLALPLAPAVCALPVALKALGELHHATVLQSNALARQGLSTPDQPGEDARLSRQRAGGISGGFQKQPPSWQRKVPSRPVAGDLRKEYEVGGLGNATSSRGNLVDILLKVPRKTHGTADYKRSNRPKPKRLPGFGNQSFSP